MEQKQIFDDFPEVSCNGCTHYYDETCDGTPQGSQRLCKAFKATRRVDIPLQLNEAQRAITRLKGALIGLGLALLSLAVAFILHLSVGG